MQTKRQQTEATTRRILAAARELFTSNGYAGTSTEQVVIKAGVTRGALYHHYRNKEALFEAVFFELQEEIGTRISQSGASEKDLWVDLVLGCCVFLDACCEPSVRQIVILDAPAVLGTAAWRGADERYSTHQLRNCLQMLAEKGDLSEIDVDMATDMLNGALNEAALAIGASPDPRSAYKEATKVLDRLITGISKGNYRAR